MDNFRNRVFWKACEKANIRRRRVHDTRHTVASLLLSNGEPLKYVSAQLGYSSIRMTADDMVILKSDPIGRPWTAFLHSKTASDTGRERLVDHWNSERPNQRLSSKLLG